MSCALKRKGEQMSKLLLDENPLVILPQLAVEVGLNEAVFIQQLHYWVNSKNAKVIDGEKWVYNTYDDWQKQFPFWSTRTLRRIITNCENMGLIKSGNFNKKQFDKTKWYTINYSAIDDFDRRCAQNEQTMCPEWTDGAVQNEQTNTIDYPEITSEIKKLNKKESFFDLFWQAYPKKVSKGQAVKTFNKVVKDEKTLNLILKDLERRKGHKDWLKENGQFIPYPSTYLNNTGWEDEYDVDMVDCPL